MSIPIESDVSTWTYMPWHEEYVMQNKRLTKEHYKLVFLTNHIQHLLDQGQHDPAREIFINDVAPVARRHLRFEILIMNTINFKGVNQEMYDRHCKAHAKLEVGIDDICVRIADTDMSNVVSFLRDWLDNHIRKDDAAYNAEIVKLCIKDG